MDALQPATESQSIPLPVDPLSAEHLDPATYEELLPYLLLPMAGYW